MTQRQLFSFNVKDMPAIGRGASRSIRLGAAILAFTGLAVATAPRPVCAQASPPLANIIPESESVTLHATIAAINAQTRAVSLRGRSGETVTVTAGPAVRLEMLKVGDMVNAQYYRSVAWELAGPAGGSGTSGASDTEIAQVLARPAHAPGGIGARVTKISGTVVGIDLAAHRVQIINPSGGAVHTIDVNNATRLEMVSQLKVGDTVTAVISEAIAVSIQPAQTQ